MDTLVDDFIRAARAYCALIEHDGSDSPWMFARECLLSVLELYRTALLLPETEPDSADSCVPIDHDQWDTTRRRLHVKISRDIYWDIFEPLEHEQPDPSCGSLSDDLGDIWRDVKPGLIVIGRSDANSFRAEAVDEAVWQWRFSFESHWGAHASGAIKALHALCFGPFADTSRPTTLNHSSD